MQDNDVHEASHFPFGNHVGPLPRRNTDPPLPPCIMEISWPRNSSSLEEKGFATDFFLPIFTFALSLTGRNSSRFSILFFESFHEKNSFRFSPATSFLLPSRSRTDFDSSRENKGKREKERERDRQKDIIARAGGHYHVEC